MKWNREHTRICSRLISKDDYCKTSEPEKLWIRLHGYPFFDVFSYSSSS
ncbi:hypothetical protein NT04LS_3088, partial [Listeria seeligeri FSL S4-171]